MKLRKIGSGIVSLTMVASLSGGMATQAVWADNAEKGDNDPAAAIAIDAAHFPDEKFREDVKQFDLDENGVLSEAERAEVDWVHVSELGVRSLKGIEYFPNMRQLYCSVNEIEELDVSKNPELQTLDCDSNKLTKLDISHNPKLTDLSCSYNKIQALDCSKNTNLEQLSCNGVLNEEDEKSKGTLTSLNVKGCTRLNNLAVCDNKLTSLDLSTNSRLISLFCMNNQLTELDVSHMASLSQLGCGDNNLTTLDVSNNKNLGYLEFAGNNISSIDLSNNQFLRELRCSSNSLTSLDLSKACDLYALEAHDNKLESLDISNTIIADYYKESERQDKGTYYYFYCEYQDEEEWDESFCLLSFDKNVKLNTKRSDEIVCKIDEKTFPDMAFRLFVSQKYDLNHDKQLSKSEISKVRTLVIGDEEGDRSEGIQSLQGIENFSYMWRLTIFGTQIESLTLPKMDSLTEFVYNGASLDEERGSLKKLDLSQCPNLSTLDIYHAGLTSVALPKTGSLRSLYFENLALKSLDLSAHTNLRDVSIVYCDVCREVKFGKNENLENVSLNESAVSKLDVSQCPNLTNLDCYETPIKSLDISSNTNLEGLNLNYAGITGLDTSKNSKLESLSCGGTAIKELDLSNNSHLRILEVSLTSLTKLDLSGCPEMENLHCEDLALKELDLSKNPKMMALNCAKTKISKLDCSPCPYLEELECNDNPNLVELNISKNQLRSLDCCETSLETLDLSNQNLQYLACGGTKIKDLDLSKQTNLAGLVLYGMGLTQLDLKDFPELVALDLHDNLLSKLDLNKNLEMMYIDLRFNMFDRKPKYKCWGDEFFEPQKYVPQVKGLKLDSRDDKSVTISWNEVVGADAYEVLRSEKDDTNFGSIGTLAGLTFKDETAEAGKEYYYSIRAYKDLETEYKLGFWYGEPSDKLKVEAATVTPPPSEDPTFEDFVERLYTVALGRESDAEGKAFWVKQVVEEGKTGADCARFFLLDAPEFMNRNLSTEDFVETLYKTFFDRESDAEGKKGWVDAISSGAKTRAEVVNDFIESTEWCDVCATYGVKSGAQYHKATKASKNAINFATRLYTCCLKRDAEDGGLKYWSLALTNLEQTGASAAQFFFESDEFKGFNTTDKEYLLRLYTTFMDREPADSEVNYWLGEIAGGRQDRHSILAFFAQSEEFTGICKQYGIDRGTIA